MQLHASEMIGLATFSTVVVVVFWLEARLLWRMLRLRPGRSELGPPSRAERFFASRRVRAAVHASAACVVLCIVYGHWEADALDLQSERIVLPGLRVGHSVTVLHLSDLHLEGEARRVRRLRQLAAQLRPDLVLYTGDYLNDPASADLLRDIAGAIHAKASFAVSGNWDLPGVKTPSMKALAAAGVTPLMDRRVRVETVGGPVQIVGLGYPAQPNWQRLVHEADPAEPLSLLYHSPDLVEAAAALDRPMLYLCGHTHGGQIRIPWYGAIVTLAEHGKRYEMGRYDVGKVQLYVSRGLGMEGHYAPRVRFLCPPEITLVTLASP